MVWPVNLAAIQAQAQQQQAREATGTDAPGDAASSAPGTSTGTSSTVPEAEPTGAADIETRIEPPTPVTETAAPQSVTSSPPHVVSASAAALGPASAPSIDPTPPSSATAASVHAPSTAIAESGATLTPPSSSLAPKPSVASIQSAPDSLAQYGSSVTAKPSFASIPESTRGLLGHGAPFAGQSTNVTAKPSLASLPESPKSPSDAPKTFPFASAWSKPATAAASGSTVPTQGAQAQAPARPAGQAATGAAAPNSQTNQWKTTPATKKDEYKQKATDFFRIFSFSTWQERMFLGVAALCAMASGCTFPLMIIVFGRLVSTVTTYYTPDMTEQQAEEIFTDSINQCVLFMVYLFIARFILGYCSTIGFRMISLRISAAMRLAYMKSLLNQPISTLDSIPPGQTAAIITNTANNMQLGISEKLAIFISAISLVVASMIISFLHSWKLTLVTSSGLVIIVATYGVTIPMVIKKMKQVEDSEIKSAAVAAEAFASVRMIAANGAETKMAQRYNYWVQESRKRGVGIRKIASVQQAIVFFTVYASFALTFWFAIKLYMNWEIPDAGSLIIVLMSVMMIVMSIGSISAPISAAARSASAAALLFKTIDLPKREISGAKEPDVDAGADITLANVNFTYPTRPDMRVLTGLSVTFPAGKITAIVGASGSGKSTIVGLLERWYELDGDFQANLKTLFFRSGQIKVGGHHLKEIDLKWWRSQIGLVQQEPFLFNDTILKNVEYGLVGTQWENAPSFEKKFLALKACREAFADEFIERLPDGYDTRVGDAGIKLSGGQRQRIAIARAIVKQPKILILDEATSAIDVRSEQIVQAALDRVSVNRTTITIAHRLSTIRKAHNIVVLNKGQAVQQGTHEALMAQVGRAYWTLATSQQLSLDDEHIEGSEAGDKEKARSMDIMETEASSSSAPNAKDSATPDEWVDKGFFKSFGILIVEQGKHWLWYIMLLFGALIAGASSPAQAFLFAELLSGFYLFGEYLQMWINFWCLMFTVVAIAVGIGYFCLGWSATTLAFYITAIYRREYFQNIISKNVAFFDEEKHSVGGLTAVVAGDPTQLQQLLGMNIGFALISVISVVGCLAISFVFGWKLTLVALSSSLPLILAAGFFRIRYETHFDKMNKEVFAESAKYATESIGACRTVAALTLEDSITERYESLMAQHVREAFRRARLSTLVFAASDALPLLCMAFVLWYGGKLLASHEYQPFQYLIVYIAVVQGGIGAGQWLSFGPNIAQATASANRILAMRRKETGGTQNLPMETVDDDDGEKKSAGVKLEFHNVWFRYPTRDAPVLNGLNLTIEKGQFAAIVGASGAGKTSVISLLERFYAIKSGSITYNGVDIDDLDLEAYRKSISLVAQEPSLFTGTIRQNILVGVDEESVTDEELHQVCSDVEIHDFIVSLPDGYNTRIGLKGVLLSGGQRQRISIARALIRKPRLLLLDEATSALDSETEKQVQRVFEKTKRERTMVVVAHRLATIQRADVIFVLGDGKVLESGSHIELLAKRGVYYHMCLSQALDR